MKKFGFNVGYYGMKIFNFVFVNAAKVAAYLGAKCIDAENYFAGKLAVTPTPNTLAK